MQTILHTEQVAIHLGICKRKAATLMQQMNRINIGTENKPMWVVTESDLERWIASRREVKSIQGFISKKRGVSA